MKMTSFTFEDLKKECFALIESTPLTNFKKRSKMIDQNQCISDFQDVWLLGPECEDFNDPNWFNFALVINSNIIESNLNHLPSLKAFFETEKNKISFAGLSLLKAKSAIPKHRDFNDFQPIHYNIISNDDCVLYLMEENREICQTEGSIVTLFTIARSHQGFRTACLYGL